MPLLPQTASDPHLSHDLGIHCPRCGYSLRGLDGVMVTCPECGTPCDVPQIIRQRRIDRWRNPEYRTLSAPAVVLTGGLVLWMCFMGFFGGVHRDESILFIGGFIVLLVWAMKLAAALIRGGDAEGVRLIMLLHLVYLGFAVLVLGGLGLFIVKLVSMADAISAHQSDRAIAQGVLALAAAMVCLGSVPLLRWLDRGAGRACIRRLLRRDMPQY